jgi:AcrR family transcriptional regulator
MPENQTTERRTRTQRERREGTIRKLLDATTEILIEEGYANASIQRICARAEVSQGGLFRHFATREALMVAAAEDVGQRILDHYQQAFEERKDRGGEEPLVLALRLVRDACRSRLNQAWYELAIAARTNPALKKALAPIGVRYYEKINALGRSLLPELAATLGEEGFTTVTGTIIAMFDGESVQRFIEVDEKFEDARFNLLLMLARTLVSGALPAAVDQEIQPKRRRP